MKRLLAIAFLVAACGRTVTPSGPAATVDRATPTLPTPTALPAPGQPSESFVAYLDGYGQRFTPAPVPATGIVSAQAVLAKLRADGFPPFASADAVAQAPIYGIVTCVDPSKNCAERGLVRPGESLAIWLVGYPTVPERTAAPHGRPWMRRRARSSTATAHPRGGVAKRITHDVSYGSLDEREENDGSSLTRR